MVAMGCMEKKTFHVPSLAVGLRATRLFLKALPMGSDLPRKDIRPLTSTERTWFIGIVLDGRKGLRERPRADGVSAGRGIEVQGMVRTLEVVEVSPPVEAALAVGQVGVPASLEQFRLEGPVEALELAEGLGMVWPAMDHPDSQLQQPDGERGEGVVEVAAPGGAIVYQYRVGHAVAAENGREMVMDSLSPLVCTSPHAQGEPRMVVQYRQWVAPSTTAYRDMPLESPFAKGRWAVGARSACTACA